MWYSWQPQPTACQLAKGGEKRAWPANSVMAWHGMVWRGAVWETGKKPCTRAERDPLNEIASPSSGSQQQRAVWPSFLFQLSACPAAQRTVTHNCVCSPLLSRPSDAAPTAAAAIVT
jgi:hypothetical protein